MYTGPNLQLRVQSMSKNSHLLSYHDDSSAWVHPQTLGWSEFGVAGNMCYAYISASLLCGLPQVEEKGKGEEKGEGENPAEAIHSWYDEDVLCTECQTSKTTHSVGGVATLSVCVL